MAALAFALAPAEAAPAQSCTHSQAGGVVLHLLGEQTRSFTAGEVCSFYDVSGSYRLSPGGGTVSKSGVSVRLLLENAGVTLNDHGFTETSNPNGTWDTLEPADLAEQPDFEDGPALIYVNGDAMAYFHPVHGSHSSNTISTSGAGVPLDLFVRNGNLLSVTASADRSSASAGQTVRFTASASGRQPGEQVSYSWRFDDGTAANGASVSHVFAGAGFYRVLVTAKGDSDSGGIASVSVRVGKAPASGQQQGGGKSTTPGAPSSGPAAGSGKGGQSTSGHGSGGSGGPSASKQHRHTKVKTPATQQPPAASGSAPSPPSSTKHHPAAGSTPARKHAPPGSGAPSGLPVVHGVLLASVTPLTPGGAAATAAAAAGQAAGSHTPARQPLALPLGLLAVAALLFGGARRESGGLRRAVGRPA